MTSFSRRVASMPQCTSGRHELVRVLSKLGICSRSEAQEWVAAGRVSVDGQIVHNPRLPVAMDHGRLAIDGVRIEAVAPVYIMLNKPRGLVVSASDERGRDTVYGLLAAAGLPWIGPVGRLDKASEGLLLLSNDTAWASGITDPATHMEKIYHVHVDRLVDEPLLVALAQGVEDGGERLGAKRVNILRHGGKNTWLEVVLEEGRNRQIRRLLSAHRISVLRLLRVAVGQLQLGTLAKGQWRHLVADEVQSLNGEPASRRSPLGSQPAGSR